MDESQNNSELPSVLKYEVKNPELLSQNLIKVMETGSKAFNLFLEKTGGDSGPYNLLNEAGNASRTLGDVARYWLNDPKRFSEAQSKLLNKYSRLWNSSLQRFMGQDVEPVQKPGPGDNRFQDDEWTENPVFDFLKQAYLVTSDWAQEMVETSQDIETHTKQRAEFYAKLINSALSPSNFLFTNPEVLKETLQSNGENLIRGMQNLTQDLEQSKEMFKISQTDLDAFEVGKNLAVTPGKVIYQNELIQLIQYSPATEEVFEIPLLIVPPWINKYYILDLVPKKSFIAWAVAQGFTVFTISWVNPNKSLADKNFTDYMKEGLFSAINAVQETTGVRQINALGYCVGGTLLATSLAYMAEHKINSVQSASFLTTQVDFSDAGDLLVFIDDDQLSSLENLMSENGYLDGSRMCAVFNFMRPKDLVWPYVINNYMLGKKPFPFDLLYWNQDSTRMPAANHAFYLREFYKNNNLADRKLVIDGTPLDLSKVKIPIYELASKEDHIAPARSVYRGSRLFGGMVKFVLAGSGHIAGVVNPPNKHKYQYWTNRRTEETLDNWLETATETPGSWWPDWANWLGAKSGSKTPARDPSEGTLKPIEDAPGSYVKVKI
ncbi:MAG: PHA/PHB synthase family protein [Methyloligellaceae bacterium]